MENTTLENSFNVYNPYTKKVVGSVPSLSSGEIRKALEASYQYQCQLTAEERAVALEKIADQVVTEREELAQLITMETGLSLKDTRHETQRVVSCARYAANVARIIEKDITKKYLMDDENDPELSVVTEPLDLIVGITPFNHPINQVAHKIFPAIAAGTSIVLKPSEKTPLSAIRLVEICHANGLDEGLVRVVAGHPAERVVDDLLGFSKLDMVSFTGGLDIGKLIKQKMISNGHELKRYVCELGGSSSVIVNNDADIDKSLKVILSGCFANSGQRCTAIRRVIVHQDKADELVAQLKEKISAIRYGNPTDSETELGTVISEEAAQDIEERVQAAINDGAQLICGHQREGALYAPTLLDNVTTKMELIQKETFGPICAVIRVSNLDEAIEFANDTNYRLAGAVMTESKETAQKVADALKVGQFNWNGPPGYRTEVAPFGGFGDSGNGEKEGILLAAESMRRVRTFYAH